MVEWGLDVTDMTVFWLVLGLGLLFSALVAMLKVGLWVWIVSLVLGRPPQYQTALVVRSASMANGLKKWLTIVATILGTISTTVGLVKGCEEASAPVFIPSGQTAQYRPQRNGYRCCTDQGTCDLLFGTMPVGSPCLCTVELVQLQGTVCE
jgi:hypothetical protein